MNNIKKIGMLTSSIGILGLGAGAVSSCGSPNQYSINYNLKKDQILLFDWSKKGQKLKGYDYTNKNSWGGSHDVTDPTDHEMLLSVSSQLNAKNIANAWVLYVYSMWGSLVEVTPGSDLTLKLSVKLTFVDNLCCLESKAMIHCFLNDPSDPKTIDGVMQTTRPAPLYSCVDKQPQSSLSLGEGYDRDNSLEFGNEFGAASTYWLLNWNGDVEYENNLADCLGLSPYDKNNTIFPIEAE